MQPNDTEKDTPKDKKSKWSVLTVFIWFRLQRYKKKCICARKKIKYFILRDYFTTIETTCGADRSNECEIRTHCTLKGEKLPRIARISTERCLKLLAFGRNLIKSFNANIRPLSSVLRNKLPPLLISPERYSCAESELIKQGNIITTTTTTT